ncbi:MAG TPA: hypothetical protein PLM34_11880, partial [Lentimicrobium sp.]|nr:hypothetical protein [Lentimicrobium sp.]
YDNLRRSIIDAAVAKAYESKITEAQIKIIELETERTKKVIEFNKNIAGAATIKKTPGGSSIKFGLGVYKADSAQSDIEDIDKQIKDLNAQIVRYSNNINISDLLFGPDGPNKPKKDLDELKQAEEALEKAVVGGNRAVIDQMAQRVALLKKERELRQWIAEEAVAFANGTVTQAQRDSIFYPKPITGKTEAGTKVGDTRTTNKILYEVVAIDKTGPVWKKVGLESDKLRKKIEQNAKDAGKAQEKLDEDEINRKAENQERLLNYSRQFTGELIDQLGLTKEQSELLYGISDTMKNMSSGDILGAYFSAASIVLKSMKDSLVKTEDEDADYVANSINRQNQLLAVMKTYLATLRGEDYFVFAKETLKQYNSDLADTWTNLQKFKQVQLKERDPSTGAFIKINTQDFELNDWIELLNRMEKEGVWNDSPALTDMKAFVAQIQDLGVAINALLEESWNNVTGTTRDTIADQIIAGFKKGTESGTDIMRNAVIEAFKTNLIEGDLTDWYKGFAEAGMDGFTKEEIDYWQKKYNEMIALQKEQWDNIEKITGVNPNDTETNASPKGLTGSIQGLTEETGGMIAGYLIGVKTDIRTIIGNMSRNDDDMVKKLGYLKEIAEN